MIVKYYDKDELCSVITVNQSSGTVCVSNYTDNNIKRAFGVNENPTMADFEEFLEDRCIPQTRQLLKLYLKQIGVAAYDPLEIVKKTNGRMHGDSQWLTVEDEE